MSLLLSLVQTAGASALKGLLLMLFCLIVIVIGNVIVIVIGPDCRGKCLERLAVIVIVGKPNTDKSCMHMKSNLDSKVPCPLFLLKCPGRLYLVGLVNI